MTSPARQDEYDEILDQTAKAAVAEDATRWEKKLRALTMRNGSASWPAIAAAFGISTNTAKRWVREAMHEVVKLPVDQMVDRQRAILMDITRANYLDALDRTNPERREAQSIIIRCMEHEAKLYGLYAPARVAVGISENEFGENAAELLKAVGFGPLAELAGVGRAEMEKALRVAQVQPPAADPSVEPAIDVDEVPIPSPESEPEAEEPWSNL